MILNNIITNTVYLSIWCFFVFVYFKVLRAARIERMFEQGKLFEIKLAYFLLTFLLSFLTTEAFWKLITLFTPNL